MIKMAIFDIRYVPTSKIGMFTQVFLSPVLAVTLDSMKNKITRKSLLAGHRVKKGISLLRLDQSPSFPTKQDQ